MHGGFFFFFGIMILLIYNIFNNIFLGINFQSVSVRVLSNSAARHNPSTRPECREIQYLMCGEYLSSD